MRGHDTFSGYSTNSFISADARYAQLQDCLRFGITQLDELLVGALRPGSLVLFYGEWSRGSLRKFITQMTVSLLSSNPTVDIAFVDGANIFPYHDVSLEVRKQGYDPLKSLDRIQLARAFNYHQITEIVTKNLPQLIHERPTIRLIFVPQISSQYLSEEAAQYLAYAKQPAIASLAELKTTVGKLKSLALQYDLAVITTAEPAPHSRNKALGGTFIAHAATTVVRVSPDPARGRQVTNYRFFLQQDPAHPETVGQIKAQPLRMDHPLTLTRFLDPEIKD
ncbi:MAG: hypothetical protein ACFFFG_06655 [Candidatus Thorarchaeota archaeon]